MRTGLPRLSLSFSSPEYCSRSLVRSWLGCMAEGVQKIKIEQHSIIAGVWCASWLFTIGFLHLGFLHLGFWRAVLAIAIWPYTS